MSNIKKEEFIEMWTGHINVMKQLTASADNKEERNEILDYVKKGLELTNKFADNTYGTDGISTKNALTEDIQEFQDKFEFENQRSLI